MVSPQARRERLGFRERLHCLNVLRFITLPGTRQSVTASYTSLLNGVRKTATDRIVAIRPASCPTDAEEIAEAYVMGMLPIDDVAAFEEHWLACRYCQAKVEAAEQYVRVMRAALTKLSERG